MILLLLGGMHLPPAFAAAPAATIGELKQLNIEDLMNIEVISVARRPERLLGAAAAIQVVTGEAIRRSGATTLAEALRLADNLQVAQRGAIGWAVSARGFNTDLANKLLVMIDGRTVYTPLFSGVFWEAQDYLLEDVERIEVISGPGGTLWGANAVNGVISIITRGAADTMGLYAEAGSGPEVTAVAGLRFGTELAPGVHVRAYGKHLEHDDGVITDGTAALDGWRRSQGGFRLDAGSGADAYTLQGDFYDNRGHDRAADDVAIMRGANLLGRWTRRFAEDSSLSLQSYFDWTRFSDPVPEGRSFINEVIPAGRLRDDLHTIDLDFQHTFRPAAAHGITWGLGFRHTRDVIANAPGITFLPARLNQQLFSLFVQDEIRLRDDLSFTVGSKVEHNDYTGFEFEPSARLQWQARETATVWAAVSRAIRMPSRIDRDLFQPAPDYFPLLYGNPEFRSEELIAYELGYRAGFGQRLSMSVATFYNEYDHVRSTDITPLPFVLPFRFDNDLYGHTWGVEFTGNLQLTDYWSLHAGYNLLEESLRVRPGQTDISFARNETADPEQQVSLRSSLTLPRGLELDAGLRWVDRLHNNNGPNPGMVPEYLELEARLAWHATDRLELSLTGQNLLHGRHPEYGFPGPARTEAERSILGKIAWRH